MRQHAALTALLCFSVGTSSRADFVVDCSVKLETSGTFFNLYTSPATQNACVAPSGKSTLYSYFSPAGGGIAPAGDARCEIPGSSIYDMDVDGVNDGVTECGVRTATPSNSVFIRSKGSLGRTASTTFFNDSFYPPTDPNVQWFYDGDHTHATKFTVTNARVYRLRGTSTRYNHNYPTDGRFAEVRVQLTTRVGPDCSTVINTFTNPAPAPSIALNGGAPLPVGDYCLLVAASISGSPSSAPYVQGEYNPTDTVSGPSIEWDYEVRP